MGMADVHLHTTASDGMMSPAMLLNYVSVHTRLDLIAITDHNTLDGYFRAREFHDRREKNHLHDLTLIPGVEVSSRDGHVLGINLTRLIPRGLSAVETVAAIHEAGGLAFAPHPYAKLPGLKDFAGVRGRFLVLPFDAVETRNSIPTELFNNPLVSFKNRRGTRPWPNMAGVTVIFSGPLGGPGHNMWDAAGRILRNPSAPAIPGPAA